MYLDTVTCSTSTVSIAMATVATVRYTVSTVSDCILPRSSFYIMKSFSPALVFSSSSVNYTHILTSPLRIVTDFNPTDCDRYHSTSQPLISPTPLLCNDRNREALSVIIHKAD